MQPQPSTAPVSARLHVTPSWSWWKTLCASPQSMLSETLCSSWGRWDSSSIWIWLVFPARSELVLVPDRVKSCQRSQQIAEFITNYILMIYLFLESEHVESVLMVVLQERSLFRSKALFTNLPITSWKVIQFSPIRVLPWSCIMYILAHKVSLHGDQRDDLTHSC